MHRSFLEFLADPISGASLQLEADGHTGDFVSDGRLVCENRSYPIVGGVPRFAGFMENSYTKSFSYQWTRWARIQFESQNAGQPMEGHTLKMWESIVAAAPMDLRGQVVTDFGCGSGRFIEIVRMKGGKVIGVDISDSVEVAQKIFGADPNVMICQADLMNPPIRAASMDGGFSIGVLHHTPDPRRGLLQIAKTVKQGGWVAVSLYGKRGYYNFPTVRLYRRVFRTLWPLLGPYPALIYSYLAAYVLRPISFLPGLGLALRALFPIVRLPDVRWSLLDTFDSVTPQIQSTHEPEEILTWFRECGITQIRGSDWGPTAMHGIVENVKMASRGGLNSSGNWQLRSSDSREVS